MNKLTLRLCILLLIGGTGFGYVWFISSHSVENSPSGIITDTEENQDSRRETKKEKNYHIGDEEFWDKAQKAACMDSYDSDIKYMCKHEIEKIEFIAHWVEVSGDEITYHISFRAPNGKSFRYYNSTLHEDLKETGSSSGGENMSQEAVAVKDCGEDKIYTYVYSHGIKYTHELGEIDAEEVTLKYEENGKVIEKKYIFERRGNEILEKSSDSFIDENEAVKIISKDSGVDEGLIRNADEDTWMYLMIFNGLNTTEKIYHYQFTDKGYTYKYELDAVSGMIITKDVQKDIGEKGALDIAMQEAGLNEDSFWWPAGGYTKSLVMPDIEKEELSGEILYKVGIAANDDKYYYYEISGSEGKITKSTITENFTINKKSGTGNNLTYTISPKDKESSERTINLHDLGMDDIYDYKDSIYLRLKFEGNKVIDRRIVDMEEGNALGKLSAEELFEEYYFEKKYEHFDAGHLAEDEDIYLSKQKEGVIYDYYVEGYCDAKIINDLGKDLIVFNKETGRYSYKDDSTKYNKSPYLKNDLYGSHYDGCGGKEGYTYSVLYKEASSDDILKTVGQTRVYYLSSKHSYTVGDEIDRDYNMDYIYNDTQNVIRLKFFNDVYYRNNLDEGIILTLHPDEWAYTNSSTKLTIVGENEIEGKLPTKPITKEIAEKYINGEIDDNEMRKYKSIDVEGAKMLAEYYIGKDPELGGLENISVEAATELAKSKSDYFRFDSLKSLNRDTAEELAKFKGSYMSFDSLETIDAGTAAGLGKYRGKLNPYDTDEHAKYFGPILDLNGLKTISVDAAAELAKSKSSHLTFGGLRDIDKETALALAQYNGKYLHFMALKKLTSEIVEAFGSRSELFFEGFPNIDKETALALSRYTGNSIHLGITEITPEIAKALSRFNGEELGLDSLTSLDKESARYLARFRGKTLRLMGLMKIDDETIKHLSTFKGQLDVSNRNSIKEKIEEEKIFANSDSKSEAEAKIRDTNRKNNLAQIQTAIIVSQMDKGYWPGKERGVTKGIDISSINTELLDAGIYSVPSDPIENSVVKGLGNYSSSKGEYGYMVSTRNGVKEGGFVLMAKTESEEGSNRVVCKNGQGLSNGYISEGIDLKNIQTCMEFTKGYTCSSNTNKCTYTDEEELRYILLY